MLTLIPHISYTMDTNHASLTVQLQHQAETMNMQIIRRKHKSRMVKLNPHGIAIKEDVIERQTKRTKKKWICCKFIRTE